MAPSSNRSFTILLVEDDSGDRELTHRALQTCEVSTDLRFAHDGEQAMDYLLRRGQFRNPGDSPRPDLILLDLNMPKINGHEVLTFFRADPKFKHIPVIVLTTSGEESDIVRCYEAGCNCYLVKPADLRTFIHLIHAVVAYWARHVTLPHLAETPA